MFTIRIRARSRIARHGHRPRFAWLGLAACAAAGLAALAVAASQNPERRLIAWAPAPPAGEPDIAETQVAEFTPVGMSVMIDNASLAPGLSVPVARQIFNQFQAQDFSQPAQRQAPPSAQRVAAIATPAALPPSASSEQRKDLFIRMMLPLLQNENERILHDRERIMAIRERLGEQQALNGKDIDWLAALARRYGADNADIDDLLRRVDAVPPSLAIAQAALETGWGTSRVALRGNALFGQMEMRSGRDDQPVFVVKTFDDLAGAVSAYALNLNSHRAYTAFRAERAALRDRGLIADGHELAAHIWRYSERGMDYVRDVQMIIRSNKLRPFDPAHLAG